MDKHSILQRIKSDLPHLKNAFGLQTIGLFGSYAKGLENSESDVDFIVSVKPPLANNFFGLWSYLEQKLEKKIDLTRQGSHLSKNFLQAINNKIIYV